MTKEQIRIFRALLRDYESILDSGDCGTPHDWRKDDQEWQRAKAELDRVDPKGA